MPITDTIGSALLDNLRHDYVHHGGLGRRLLQGDADLSFLHGTDLFLAVLVCQRYGLRLRPKPLLDAISEVLLASAHQK